MLHRAAGACWGAGGPGGGAGQLPACRVLHPCFFSSCEDRIPGSTPGWAAPGHTCFSVPGQGGTHCPLTPCACPCPCPSRWGQVSWDPSSEGQALSGSRPLFPGPAHAPRHGVPLNGRPAPGPAPCPPSAASRPLASRWGDEGGLGIILPPASWGPVGAAAWGPEVPGTSPHPSSWSRLLQPNGQLQVQGPPSQDARPQRRPPWRSPRMRWGSSTDVLTAASSRGSPRPWVTGGRPRGPTGRAGGFGSRAREREGGFQCVVNEDETWGRTSSCALGIALVVRHSQGRAVRTLGLLPGGSVASPRSWREALARCERG